MHVAVVNLTAGGLSGGYRKYLKCLLPLLVRDPRISRLDVFSPVGERVERVPGTLESHSFNASVLGPPEDLVDATRRLAPDVVFIPTARWFSCGTTPVVVMVRNMAPLVAPCGGNPPLEVARNCARRLAAKRACRRAARVIAVSAYVHDFLRDRWRVPPARMGIVHHGVEPPLRAESAVRPRGLAGTRAARLIFTAGSIRAARGLEDLVGSLCLPPLRESDLTLAIAGEPDHGTRHYRTHLHEISAKRGVASRIAWLGQLDRHEMAWCFQNCAVFVMTSRVEACPNLALEAMIYGCPIVSIQKQPMRELFGEVARYYVPGDLAGLAVRIGEMLDAPSEQVRTLRQLGTQRAATFTWERAAVLTVDQLEAAALGR
jgi:glycosyltransferase involved in cell wall biosynthesis